MSVTTGDGGSLLAPLDDLGLLARRLSQLSAFLAGEDVGAGVLTVAMREVREAAGDDADRLVTATETFEVAWVATLSVFEDSTAVMAASTGGLAVDLGELDRQAAGAFRL